MAKLKKAKKLKNREIVIPFSVFEKYKGPLPAFKKAARKVALQIKGHFARKGEGWPVSYSQYVDDVFYEVMGHHVENYLLAEVAKLKLPVVLKSIKRDAGELMFVKVTKK